MDARILEKPQTFDRVDRVKETVGQKVGRHDDEVWILGGALTFQVDGAPYVVPKGFTTDGASIPVPAQWLTGWARWDEPARWAAIVHDWAYCAPGVSKRWADRVFHHLLKAEGVGLGERTVMYGAVRLGGGPAYRSDQAEGVHLFVDPRAPRLPPAL